MPRCCAFCFSDFALSSAISAPSSGVSALCCGCGGRASRTVGANARAIVALVVRQGMDLVRIGLAAGYAGSIALTGLLRNFRYAAASALRAASTDPQEALRCE